MDSSTLTYQLKGRFGIESLQGDFLGIGRVLLLEGFVAMFDQCGGMFGSVKRGFDVLLVQRSKTLKP